MPGISLSAIRRAHPLHFHGLHHLPLHHARRRNSARLRRAARAGRRIEKRRPLSGKNLHPRPAGYEKNQAKAVEYIARSLADTGAKVTCQPFTADKRTFVNVSAVFPENQPKESS